MPRCQAFLPKSKIMFVGEAPGQQEDFFSRPFVGSSGAEFANMLFEAGLVPDPPPLFASPLELINFWQQHNIALSNVIMDRPDNNDFGLLCCGVKEAKDGYNLTSLRESFPDTAWPHSYTWGKVRNGKYLKPEHLWELDRLAKDIAQVEPNLIVALGGVAAWALTGISTITKIRGTVFETPFGKVLPTFHPAYILRVWQDRPIALADLMKAKAMSEYPEIRRPAREIWIHPTIEDLYSFKEKYLVGPRLFFDIETAKEMITCVGFACSSRAALVVPFVCKENPGYSYYSKSDEILAWKFVKELLESPMPKCGQNGLYDLQYLLDMHIQVRNYSDDTMLLQHALQPELPKGLGFLGSIYTEEPAWKLMRNRSKDEVLKLEE